MAVIKAPARHKSAIKRKRQAEKKHEVNKSVKSMLKTVITKVEQAVAAKNTALAKESLTAAMKALDKAASRGIIHKNLASRKVSRLSARVSKTGAA